MNTQKSVFNKISKIEREVESKEVELSEVQKVEFNKIDDAESKLIAADKKADSIIRNILGATDDLAKMDAEYKSILADLSRLENSIRTSGVDDLGVDVDRVYQQIENLREATEYSLKQNAKAQSNIKNVKSFY